MDLSDDLNDWRCASSKERVKLKTNAAEELSVGDSAAMTKRGDILSGDGIWVEDSSLVSGNDIAHQQLYPK